MAPPGVGPPGRGHAGFSVAGKSEGPGPIRVRRPKGEEGRLEVLWRPNSVLEGGGRLPYSHGRLQADR
jgi:hypothetical protein